MTALAASGDWGKVTESPQSGERNVLDGTANILLNTNLFAAVAFSPQNVSITGGPDGFGPYKVAVQLSQVRRAASVGADAGPHKGFCQWI